MVARISQRFKTPIEWSHGNLVFYAFDLLVLNGKSLLKMPLIERKAQLQVVVGAPHKLRYSEHIR